MKVIQISKWGGPEVLAVKDIPTPTPATNQVRIKVRAAGLNFAELMARQGLYPDAPKPPCVLGYEIAGEVDQCGQDVDKSWLKKRVIGMTPFGGHSEYILASPDHIFEMPDEMSFEEGAAIPVNYLTAHHMLFYVGNLRPSHRVLVHMAAGGVGIAALQLCKTIDSVTTFGTASKQKHAAIKDHGCDHAIDYRNNDYFAEIKRLTKNEGVDIVLDPLGGKDWAKGYRLLKSTGRLIAFGFANMASGEKRNILHVVKQIFSIPKMSPVSLMNRNRSVSGVHLGRLWKEEAILKPAMHDLLRLYGEKKIKPQIDQIFTFERAADAHRRMHTRQNVGKIILVPN